MRGTITLRDILRHPVLIVSQFGPACFLRCMRAAIRKQPTTFLEVVFSKH